MFKKSIIYVCWQLRIHKLSHFLFTRKKVFFVIYIYDTSFRKYCILEFLKMCNSYIFVMWSHCYNFYFKKGLVLPGESITFIITFCFFNITQKATINQMLPITGPPTKKPAPCVRYPVNYLEWDKTF